jgi:hypothetical protein
MHNGESVEVRQTKLQISTFDRSETRHDDAEFLCRLGASPAGNKKN